MSELQAFAADLLERHGAAVERLEPDRLEVLAPGGLQKQFGWPEFAHLNFGTQRSEGTIAIGLEGDWLERFGDAMVMCCLAVRERKSSECNQALACQSLGGEAPLPCRSAGEFEYGNWSTS